MAVSGLVLQVALHLWISCQQEHLYVEAALLLGVCWASRIVQPMSVE